MRQRVFRIVYSCLVALAAFGMGCNIYFGCTLPKVPDGLRDHIIDLGKGPKVFGTGREYEIYEISKWLAVIAIIGGVFFVACVKYLQTKMGRSK